MAENEKDIITGEKEKNLLDMFKSNLDSMTTPKVDTTAVDEQIRKLSTPKDSSVDEKLAALYRRQGSGRVLEIQKNIALATAPAFELYKTRKAASDAEFQERTKNMPDYDDTNIFGEANGTQIPLSDNIKNISNLLKEDYRLISNLNINDPRYEEARKRIEQNQKIIVNYDAVNKKLFDIRNGRDRDTGEVIQQIPLEEFDEGMEKHEAQMWKDIYAGNGSNIKNIDGNLFWVDPTDPENKKKQIDLRYISNSPTQINGVAVNAYVTHRGIEAEYINKGGLLDDYSYTSIIEASLNNLIRLKPNEIKSLIFNGINVEEDDIYGGPETKEFILKVIKDTFGDLDETEILAKIDEMKSISVIDSTKYKDENGEAASLKKLFLKHETNKTRNAIQDAADKKEEEERRKKASGENEGTDDGGGEDVEDPTKESNVRNVFKNDNLEIKVNNPNDIDSGFIVSKKGKYTKTVYSSIAFKDNQEIKRGSLAKIGIKGKNFNNSVRTSVLYKALSNLNFKTEDQIKELAKNLLGPSKNKDFEKTIIDEIRKVQKDMGLKTRFVPSGLDKKLSSFGLSEGDYGVGLSQYIFDLIAKITSTTPE
tara:strand:+ start:1012 stop:2793 length:1782 start_codon:yes stop_codon:yes gene_type:complete